MLDQKKTVNTSEFGLEIGGYRVAFTNWNGNGRETFFQNKFDAIEYLNKFEAYGYKGSVETIWFHVKAGK